MGCFQLFTGLITGTGVRRMNVCEKTGRVILVWFPSSLSDPVCHRIGIGRIRFSLAS